MKPTIFSKMLKRRRDERLGDFIRFPSLYACKLYGNLRANASRFDMKCSSFAP